MTRESGGCVDIDYGLPLPIVAGGMVLHACPLCGSVVVFRPIHTQWHTEQTGRGHEASDA